MSLNKFTDTKIKEWMDIGCDQIACNGMNVAVITTDQINVVNDSPTSAVYLKMTNNDLPSNSRTYGFYSSVPSNACWFAKFSDIGGANTNYVCYEGGGGITIPTATLRINAGGLNLNNAGALLNVPSSASAGSFYETYTSTGNNYQGAFTTPQAKEFKVERIGQTVILSLGLLISPASNATVIGATVSLPVEFRPTTSAQCPIVIQNAGVNSVGMVQINSVGVITIFPTAGGGNFTASGSAGFIGATATYSLNMS